jgi:hypothetical protein
MRRALNVLQVSSLLTLLSRIVENQIGNGRMTLVPVDDRLGTYMRKKEKADSQACHAAYDIIDETAVYTCTGNPQPKDIERVVQSMMSDEFGTSYSRTSFPFL